MGKIPIIQSQLSPPPLKDRFIHRATLNRKLMAASSSALTLVHAGAGYGKSTALALYVRDVNREACWYSISRNDDDFIPFINKLVHAIKLKYSSFGNAILNELEDLDNYAGTEKIWSLMSSFINEILTLGETIVLVFDDFHHVIGSREIEQWINWLLEYIPENLHIVISSRTSPKWDIITNFKLKGDLLEITQHELILSREEMLYILEDDQLQLTSDDLGKVYNLTEGWPIAVSMFAQHLRSDTSIDVILQNKQRSLEDVFNYMASEVLSRQPLMIQQFLLQSSIIDVLSPDVSDQVLQINGSAELLSGLVQQNLFIVEGEGDHYRYHALFKAFLEGRFKKDFPDDYQALNKRAADYYEKIFHMETALNHYRKINDHKNIAHMLREHSERLLQSGRLQQLLDILTKLPEELKEKHLELYLYQGDIERYRSHYVRAETNYDKVLSSPHHNDNIAGLALEGKARIYLDTIQPDKAERYVNQAIHRREKSQASGMEMAQLYQLMAENLINAGQANKAEAWFDRAKELNLPMEEGNLQARIYLRTGRLILAKENLLQRKQNVKNAKHVPQSHRETDILLSIVDAFMGEASASKKLAEAGIQLGSDIQSPFVEACGWMRMGHAVQLLDHYDTELSVSCYEKALDMMETLNVSRGKAEPYMGLAIFYGKRTQYDKAIEMATKGLRETERVNDRWLSAMIKLSIGMAEVYNGHWTSAKHVMQEVNQEFDACGDKYGIMITRFWNAYIAFENNHEANFKGDMEQFFHAIQTDDFAFFMKKRTVFGPNDVQNIVPMLLKAKNLAIAPTFASRLLHEMGFDNKIKNHPGYTLTINTLGPMKVWLGNRKLQTSDWQRGKAKELFQLFVTNRNRTIPKVEILQTMWPDYDEQSADKTFKVTLNALLRTLEPKRQAREESFFIKRKESAYGLNPEAGYKLDSVMFEEGVFHGINESDPKRSQAILDKALLLYKGYYLEDAPHDAEWCLAEREHLQLVYIRGAEKRSRDAVRLHEFDVCINWCEKILAIDNTWEEAYRLLMYSYYQKNNRPQAIKWYERCIAILNDELAIEPMASTRKMYHMIMESEELNVY